jgi:hypothetical protein
LIHLHRENKTIRRYNEFDGTIIEDILQARNLANAFIDECYDSIEWSDFSIVGLPQSSASACCTICTSELAAILLTIVGARRPVIVAMRVEGERSISRILGGSTRARDRK